MFSAIVAALKAIPQIVGLFRDLNQSIKAYLEKQRTIELENFITEGKELIHEVKKAQTDAERQRLAERLSDLIGRIP